MGSATRFPLRSLSAAAGVFGGILAMGCVGIAYSAAGGGGVVSLPAGAGIERTVEALAAARNGVVVADVSSRQPHLRSAVNRPFMPALETVSSTFDRAIGYQDRLLVLQRRRSDPDDDPGLELEEVRSVANDLYDLITPVSPYVPLHQRTQAHRAFEASLNPAQQQQMMGSGLSFRALSKEQQAAWLQFTGQNAYSASERELYRLREVCRQWNNAAVQRREQPNPPALSLTTSFADRRDPTGHGFVEVRLPSNPPVPRAARPQVLPILSDHTKPPSDLSGVWTVPTCRLTLGDFSRRFTREGGPRLEIPAYATSRTIDFASSQGTRAECIQALCELWGWEYHPVKNGYRMGRPAVRRATGHQDVFRQVTALIPPLLRHTVDAELERATDRRRAEADRIFAEIMKNDRNPKTDSLGVNQLSEDAQRRLANLVATNQISAGLKLMLGSSGAAPAWLARPEEGVFHLSGPLGQNEHPLLTITVPDGNLESTWGWVVGSGGPVGAGRPAPQFRIGAPKTR